MHILKDPIPKTHPNENPARKLHITKVQQEDFESKREKNLLKKSQQPRSVERQKENHQRARQNTHPLYEVRARRLSSSLLVGGVRCGARRHLFVYLDANGHQG